MTVDVIELIDSINETIADLFGSIFQNNRKGESMNVDVEHIALVEIAGIRFEIVECWNGLLKLWAVGEDKSRFVIVQKLNADAEPLHEARIVSGNPDLLHRIQQAQPTVPAKSSQLKAQDVKNVLEMFGFQGYVEAKLIAEKLNEFIQPLAFGNELLPMTEEQGIEGLRRAYDQRRPVNVFGCVSHVRQADCSREAQHDRHTFEFMNGSTIVLRKERK